MVTALLEPGFAVRQMLATGIMGGGAALMIWAVAQLLPKPEPPAAREKPARQANNFVALLLIPAGLALVVAGLVWGLKSQ